MSGRPWLLAETTWRDVAVLRCDVAVLPWGATEAHNRHLPYGTDTIETSHIAEAAARLAWDAGARVIVLPAIPFGVQTGQLDIPLCINMNPSTQAAVLRDVVESLAVQSVRRLVVLNGHGGNDFRAIIRELQPRTDVFLCTIDWFRVLPAADYFDVPGDHAGELETSVMQHIAPTLVLPLSEAGSGAAREARPAAFREGWAWTPRRWTRVTSDTGVGDPSQASPAKGERYLADVVAQIGSFLVELAALEPDELYGDPQSPAREDDR